MAVLKTRAECRLSRNIVYRAGDFLSSDEAVVCYTDFLKLETDIIDSFGMNVLKTPSIKIIQNSYDLRAPKEIHKLLPYISYIQDKYGDYTYECKQGDYYNEELDTHIRIQINSDSLKTNNKPSLEAFKLVKWFVEINTTSDRKTAIEQLFIDLQETFCHYQKNVATNLYELNNVYVAANFKRFRSKGIEEAPQELFMLVQAFLYLQDHNHYPEYVKPIIFEYLGSKMLEG